jgi:hypothetical protein
MHLCYSSHATPVANVTEDNKHLLVAPPPTRAVANA